MTPDELNFFSRSSSEAFDEPNDPRLSARSNYALYTTIIQTAKIAKFAQNAKLYLRSLSSFSSRSSHTEKFFECVPRRQVGTASSLAEMYT